MSRTRPLGQLGIDAFVVVAALTSAVGTAWRRTPPPPTGPMRWVEATVFGFAVLSLLGRRRFPFTAPAAVWVLSAALSFLDGDLVASQAGAYAAGMVAALFLGNLREDRQALAGLAIVVVGAAVIVENKPVHPTSELVFTPLLFAISWLAGHVLRERADQTRVAEERAAQAVREQEVRARLAVAEERARIARELHDVVAHALSVMVLQVGAVRRRLSPAEAEENDALRNVEEAGRAALAEMRRLLRAMREDDDEAELRPQPGLGDLDALVTETRATGLDVRLHVHGADRQLPPAVGLSAYRIVQEGLTNILKHAGAGRAEVELRLGAEDLLITVTDDGHRRAPAHAQRGLSAVDGSGHGLLGIRERVSLFGGEMWAGAVDDGFQVRARLPYDGSRA